jgi:hypothetical protein
MSAPSTPNLFTIVPSLGSLLRRAGLPTARQFVALCIDTETGGIDTDADHEEEGNVLANSYDGDAASYALTQVGLATALYLSEGSDLRLTRGASHRFLVEPAYGLRMTDEALAIQGHTIESWGQLGGKISEADLLVRLAQEIELACETARAHDVPLYIVGHNLEFHLAFLRALAERHGYGDIGEVYEASTAAQMLSLLVSPSPIGRCCTMHAFRALRGQGLFQSEERASLRSIAACLLSGGSYSSIGSVHDAERDALVCSRILGEIIKTAINFTEANQ